MNLLRTTHSIPLLPCRARVFSLSFAAVSLFPSLLSLSSATFMFLELFFPSFVVCARFPSSKRKGIFSISKGWMANDKFAIYGDKTSSGKIDARFTITIAIRESCKFLLGQYTIALRFLERLTT